MLHLNVCGPTDSYATRIWRKMRWALLGLMAPELPMLFACGQWASANRSLLSMHALGYEKWSIEHAFYADSGGFVLDIPEYGRLPISAKQLEFLVRHKLIPIPGITRAEIRDKSKADEMSRIVACLQAGWLVFQVLGRAIQRLPITPLELTTISVVGCSLTTLWFWRCKPLDVVAPTVIRLSVGVPEIFGLAENVDCTTFVDTPLDFIERDVYMSRKWNRAVLRFLETHGFQETPMRRIPNDRDPQPSGLRQHISLGISTALFASLHLAAWNASFPTDWEQTFWRVNCLVMWVLLAVYGTGEVVVCWREGYSKMGLDTLGGYKRRWPACLWFFIPAGLYLCTRLGVIFESIWSMRALPSGAFVVVGWTDYIPHI